MIRSFVLVALIVVASASTPAKGAGLIERACNNSDRQAANPSLCGCIQSVADQLLTNGEQRKGAAFFADPHKSQEIRQSDKSTDETFWTKWKSFGATAAKHCS